MELTVEAVWDLLSDYSFYNFSSLLSIVKRNSQSDQIKLLELMVKSGYKEFLKTDIKLPTDKKKDIIQKLIILDLLDCTETCSQIEFTTLAELTQSTSTESLIEFLILVLTMGVLKGKINTRKKILVVSDSIPRNYGNVQDLIDKMNRVSGKVVDSIQILSSQIDLLDYKNKEWKKEEEEFQDQIKKVSDKVKRLYKKS